MSVITSAYNRVDDLIKCIDSVQKSKYIDYEMIVVDNASVDGTSEKLQEKYGATIKLVTLEKNCFSVGGKNAGIEVAVGEYLWFVDSDMIVPEMLMGDLVAILDGDNGIGLVGAEIYYYADQSRVWSSGGEISLLTSMTKSIDRDKLKNDIVAEVPIILCGYMVRKEIVEKIGGFDTRFGIVFEESDFERKIQQLNYKVILAKNLKIYHNVELPENVENPLRKYNLDNVDRAYFLARNRSLYMARYAKWYGKIFYFTFWMHLFCIYYVYKALTFKRKDIARAYLRGYVAGVKERKSL